MFAYGASADAFTNVREAAKQPWMGMTALLNNKPYLVIGKETPNFVLEGQDGDIVRLERFDWSAATDHNRLVAASRVEGSPFEAGSVLGSYLAGRLAFIDGEWFVRHGNTETLLPLEDMVEICDELRYSKTALDQEIGGDELRRDGQRLWLVTPDGHVLIEQPGMGVRSHLELAAKSLGKEWVRDNVVRGDLPLGHGGTITGDQLNYGGLYGREEGSPPKAEDPFGSIVGANRVREAINAVYAEAQAQGIPVQPNYNLNATPAGKGIVPTNRPISKQAMTGSFFNEATGQDVDFESDGIVESNSGTQAMQVYDKVTGDYYYITEDGLVNHAETGEHVGSYDAFIDPTSREPDDDRDMDWYPDWEGPEASVKEATGLWGDIKDQYEMWQKRRQPMPPYTVLPGQLPQGQVPPCPHDGQHFGTFEELNAHLAEIHGQSFDQPRGPRVDDGPSGGMPFGSPSSPRRMTNMDKLGVVFDYDMSGDGLHGATSQVMAMLGLTANVILPPNPADPDYADGLTVKIPGGSVDLQYYGLELPSWDGVIAQVETETDPETVKLIFDGLSARELPPEFYNAPEEVQKAIMLGRGVTAKTAEHEDDPLVCPKCGSHTLRAFDVTDEAHIKCLTCGNEFSRPAMANPESSVKWSMGGGSHMTAFDIMRREVIQGLGLQRIGLQENDAINAAIMKGLGDLELYTMPHKALQSVAWNKLKAYAMDQIGRPHELPADDPDIQSMWPDTLPWGDAEQDYYRNARMASKTAAEGGKLNPGTRIQIDHQAHKGQRGTIVEYKGKHKDFDEEQYEVLLDSGEKLDEVNESFFHKIKSANVVSNNNLPDTPSNYFIDSMRVSYEGLDADEMEYDIPECPACGGPGGLMGALGNRVHYRCRNCGIDFSHKEEPVPPLPDPAEAGPVIPDPMANPTQYAPGDPMLPDPMPSDIPGFGAFPDDQRFMGKNANWKDANGEPLTAGGWYRMHHGDYKVPDVVRILNLEDTRVEAAIESDIKGAFPITIKGDEGYSFERLPDKTAEWLPDMWLDDEGNLPPMNVPTEQPEWDGEPGEFNPNRNNTFTAGDRVSDGTQAGIVFDIEEGQYGANYIVAFEDGTTRAVGGNALQLVDPNVDAVPDQLPPGMEEYVRSSGWRVARRNYSPAEQRALIDENPDARARNFDKLNLEGTHYEIKKSYEDDDFLWGM